MRISNFSSMCHFFLISRGRARQLHLICISTLNHYKNRHKSRLSAISKNSEIMFYCLALLSYIKFPNLSTYRSVATNK